MCIRDRTLSYHKPNHCLFFLLTLQFLLKLFPSLFSLWGKKCQKHNTHFIHKPRHQLLSFFKMLVDVVVTYHMLPGASNSDTTLLQVGQSRDTRVVSRTSSLGLVKPDISFLLSFSCLLPSSWTHADFTHPPKCHFLGQLFHFFHSTVWCFSLLW